VTSTTTRFSCRLPGRACSCTSRIWPADYDLALFASQTTSVRTGATAGAPLQDGTVADESINTQGGLNAQLTPTALQDVPDPGIPAVQVSANRGTDDEDVGMVSPGGTGYALIAVFGYNGASGSKPYSLRVTTQAPPSLLCTQRSFTSAGLGAAGAVPAIGSMPNDLNTLVLVNEKRIGDTYGRTNETNVVSALNQLAGDRSLGVSGAVIPVEGLAQSQYDAWDQNPCDVSAANSVANAIADEIAQVKAALPSLKYVVFAGGDDQIPFFRTPDLSRIANETGFASSFGRNEYYGALASGDLLTDNPYLDTRPIPARRSATVRARLDRRPPRREAVADHLRRHEFRELERHARALVRVRLGLRLRERRQRSRPVAAQRVPRCEPGADADQ